MIPPGPYRQSHDNRKPRASGDDPETFDDRDAADRVNPARAGMILR